MGYEIMKKIPTLFERKFENHRKVGIENIVAPGMEWVLAGEGIATEKTLHPHAHSSPFSKAPVRGKNLKGHYPIV